MEASKRSSHSQRPAGRLTRKRVPLSCVACRVRKLKCNREKPCQNCIVRGDAIAATCSYAEKVDAKVSKSNPRSDAEDMRKRINRLESSIRHMMSSTGDKQTGAMPSPVLSNSSAQSNEAPDGTGGQKLSADTRSTHWDAILNDLGAMKDAWSQENDHVEITNGFLPSSKSHRPNLLNGLTELPDRSTMMASLPTKDAADGLVAYFFDNYNPSIPGRALVHKPTFLKQYANHWNDPTQTSIIWVGMLFAIMCYSVQSYRRNKQEPPEYHGTSAAIMELYRIRTAQCIGIADVTKPTPVMLQTFYLYAIVEYSDERDGDMGTYLLSGTLVRLALQQGYHRDPSQHHNISVFEAEMRRRHWKGVVQHDLLACVRTGLPKTLRYSESDTAEPRNLYEEELYEDMTELPPSRTLDEPTPMAYTISKGRIMRCYGNVVEFLHQLFPQPYEEVLRLDSALMDARQMIPLHLQLRSLDEMQGDKPSLILERYIIQLFYHKAVCLLHRKYWKSSPADSDGVFVYSRKASSASAMTLLNHQATMHKACRPGGPLTQMKWYHFAINNHDFLLAAMIICLDLMNIQKMLQEHQFERPSYDCLVPEIDKLNAIQLSRTIWSEVVDDCKDAKRAISILTGVLSKLTKLGSLKDSAQETPNLGSETPISASATNPTADSLRFSPYFTDQFGLGIPLVGEPSNGVDTHMQDHIVSSGGILDTLGADPCMPTDFDWDAWDQFLVTQSPPQPQPASQEMPNVFFQ